MMFITGSQGLEEHLSLKMLDDIIFPFLLSQSVILWFVNVCFLLSDYPWQPNLSNHTKVKWKSLTASRLFSEKLSLKLLLDIIFPSLPGQFNIYFLKRTYFHLATDYLLQPNVSNWSKFKWKNLSLYSSII